MTHVERTIHFYQKQWGELFIKFIKKVINRIKGVYVTSYDVEVWFIFDRIHCDLQAFAANMSKYSNIRWKCLKNCQERIHKNINNKISTTKDFKLCSSAVVKRSKFVLYLVYGVYLSLFINFKL